MLKRDALDPILADMGIKDKGLLFHSFRRFRESVLLRSETRNILSRHEVASSSLVVPAILQVSPSHRYALLRTSRRPRDSIMIAKPETFRSCYSTVLGFEFNLQLTLRRRLWPRLCTSV
jgi:hypothetical protein